MPLPNTKSCTNFFQVNQIFGVSANCLINEPILLQFLVEYKLVYLIAYNH